MNKKDMHALITELVAVDIQMREFGFFWPSKEYLFQHLRSEADEVQEAVENNESKAVVEEELGDLFHDFVALVVCLGHDMESVIQNSTDKFERRCKKVQQLVVDAGLKDVHGLSYEEKMAFWNRMKEEEKSKK